MGGWVSNRRGGGDWEWRWGREGLLVLAVILLVVLLAGCTAKPAVQFTPIGVGAGQSEVRLGKAKAMLRVDGQTRTVTVAPMGDGTVLVYPFDEIESIEILRANNPDGRKYVPVFDGKEDYVLLTTTGGTVVLEVRHAAHAALLLAQTGIPVTAVAY